MIEGILLRLAPLAVSSLFITGIVYGIIALRRNRNPFTTTDSGIGTIRRLYFYTMALAGLVMATSGVVEILHFVLDTLATTVLGQANNIRLAIGLSLTIVGVPLWAFHWRLMTRHLIDMPVETRSVVRKAYLYIVLTIACSVSTWAAITLVQWVFGNRTFSGFSASALFIWSMVWIYHWRIEVTQGQPTNTTKALRRLYLYTTSTSMLTVSAVGAGLILNVVFRQVYASLTDYLVFSGEVWIGSMKAGLSLFLVGGGIWTTHWVWFARRDYESTLRQLYQQVYAVIGGVITVLGASGIIIYQLLVWLIGVSTEPSAAAHFDFLPPALATLIVGVVILTYHAVTAQTEPTIGISAAQNSRNAQPYLLSLTGLVPSALAVVVLISMAIDIYITAGGTIIGHQQWRNSLAMTLTLSLVGFPIWIYYWSRGQRQTESDTQESNSTSRRIFIFLVLSTGLLATVFSIAVLIFVFLKALLTNSLSDVLSEARVALAVIGAMAFFLPYYWTVYQADRQANTDPLKKERQGPKAVTVLVTDVDVGFVHALEAVLGYEVFSLSWADTEATLPDLTEKTLQDLGQRIIDASGPKVLIVPYGDMVQVFSYQ